MTYDLYIGDRTYSSWSLRGWLMFEKFGLDCRVHPVGLYSDSFARDMAPLAPARLVPVMRTPDGILVGDTLAMAETLAERHPAAGLWPSDPAERDGARWLAAEMHSGFAALRQACPMQLRHQLTGFMPGDAVLADIARIELLWATAHGARPRPGPWLFGAYTLADVFFAPVAARIAGYDLPVGGDAAAYVSAHLDDAAFRAWRLQALAEPRDRDPYPSDLPTRPWPG